MGQGKEEIEYKKNIENILINRTRNIKYIQKYKNCRNRIEEIEMKQR